MLSNSTKSCSKPSLNNPVDGKNATWLSNNGLLQHFEKNTDMTVEEMLTTLNNLGDKLEQQVDSTVYKASKCAGGILPTPT